MPSLVKTLLLGVGVAAGVTDVGTDSESRGFGGRGSAAAHAELAQDRRDVVIDRLRGEKELLRDVRVAQSARHKPEDIQLPRCQPSRLFPGRRPGAARQSARPTLA